MSEQLLKEILSAVQTMDKRLSKLETDVASVMTDLTSVRTELTLVKADVATVKTDLTSVKADVTSVKTEVNSIRQQMVTKEDMDENTRILNALEHASQVNTAEMEGLKLNTATRESIQQLATKDDVRKITLHQSEHSKLLDALSRRSLIQETEIRDLKLVR